MLALVLEHQGERPLSDLRRVPPTFRHDLILSGDLVSIEAGAVHRFAFLELFLARPLLRPSLVLIQPGGVIIFHIQQEGRSY
jgi:hypothetical protein